MSKNSIGVIVVLVLLGGVFFLREKNHFAQHVTAPVVVTAPVKAPVISVPPLAREPVLPQTKVVKGKKVTLSAPGHRVFYLVGDNKTVHYCYEDADLPLDAADVGRTLGKYGETAPEGKLATAFICL